MYFSRSILRCVCPWSFWTFLHNINQSFNYWDQNSNSFEVDLSPFHDSARNFSSWNPGRIFDFSWGRFILIFEAQFEANRAKIQVEFSTWIKVDLSLFGPLKSKKFELVPRSSFQLHLRSIDLCLDHSARRNSRWFPSRHFDFIWDRFISIWTTQLEAIQAGSQVKIIFKRGWGLGLYWAFSPIMACLYGSWAWWTFNSILKCFQNFPEISFLFSWVGPWPNTWLWAFLQAVAGSLGFQSV